MSNPHSPLLVGIAPSKTSARAPNFATAFLEAALCFFAVQHAGSIFVFDWAPERGAPIPIEHTKLAMVAAAHRCTIFSILIFHLLLGGSQKVYSQRTTLRFLHLLIFTTKPT